MSADPSLEAAVRHAMVVTAQVLAYEQVAMAHDACARLGRLSSGRWRTAARDLQQLADELERSLENQAADLTERARRLEIHEESLWTAGDAATMLDSLRERTLKQLSPDSPAARLLEADDLIYGTSFVDDPESENRGITLLFGWAAPLQPATWPWEAGWVAAPEVSEDQDAYHEPRELDLFERGELEAVPPLLDHVAERMSISESTARELLVQLAQALTQAFLQVEADDEGEVQWESDAD